MKIIIVDDEALARTALSSILTENFPEISILASCGHVLEAVEKIKSLKPDLVFLDIEMPEYSGFDLLNFFETAQMNFQIVFITAYSHFSLRAFEVSAVDYLLKPIRIEQLSKAIEKAKKINQQKNIHYQVLKENLQHKQPQKIILHTAENIFILKITDILYLEAEGSYTRFFSTTHPPILVSKKIADFEYIEELPFFFRSHRSYLINLNKVTQVDKRDFVIVMENGASVYLAQEKKKSFLDKLNEI
ncbi:MAG: DNA-binding response regulator [Cytophagales bacterium]|nr:MAG: DNA-binding response regulator [Cytophagales bacterium]